MPALRIKRGTRAQLEAAKTAGTLAAGEPYLISDEGRIAVGTASNAYSGMLTGVGVTSLVALTQADYDALTPVSTTLYIITDA